MARSITISNCADSIRPIRTRPQGDMEAVLAAVDALGEDYVNVLNGMYALALYDARTDCLELVRDRLGVKPLYWAEVGIGRNHLCIRDQTAFCERTGASGNRRRRR